MRHRIRRNVGIGRQAVLGTVGFYEIGDSVEIGAGIGRAVGVLGAVDAMNQLVAGRAEVGAAGGGRIVAVAGGGGAGVEVFRIR